MDSFRSFILVLILIVLFFLMKTIREKKKNGHGAKQTSSGRIRSNGRIVTHPDIRKAYPGHAAPSPFCDDPSFAGLSNSDREANHAFRMLRLQYDTVIKRHNRLSAKIRRVNAAAREFDINDPETQEVINLCKKDIQDAPDIAEYAVKWAALKGDTVIYYPPYESFKRLAVIYEKQGRYEEAIDVCDQAIRLGLDNYDPSISLKKKRDKLIELAEKKETQKSKREIPAETPVRKTVFEIFTTRDELQAYEIIRSMAIELNIEDRITYKDTKSYFAILMDGNVRSWICRLRLEADPRWITFRPQKGDKEESIRISDIEEIYQFREKLVSIMRTLI